MRLRTTLSIELNEKRLDEYRDELLDRGEVLYSDDPYGGDKDVRHWPGYPSEWTSLTDITDLIEAKAIVRTEVLKVEAAPAPIALDSTPRRKWWQLWRR